MRYNNKNYPVIVNNKDTRLRFEATTASVIKCLFSSDWWSVIQYSFNGTTWSSFSNNQTVNMAAGSTLYIRGKLNQPRRNANGTLGCTSGHVVLKGDIRYLDDYETQLEATTLRFDYQFIHLFNHENLSTGKSYIYDVSELIIPYTNMRDFCYTAMFRKCDKITKSPVFKPAYNSGSYSTWQTFDGCSSLSEITWLSQYGAFSDDFATGVASTGTFYKHPNASYTVSSIPGLSSGWTIQNAQIN